MATKKSNELVFYAVLGDKDTAVKWQLADASTAYGLLPNAYLDLGGDEPAAWVLVVCRGRKNTIVCEHAWHESFYAAAPAAKHPRRFYVRQKEAVTTEQPWEQARRIVTQNQERDRYRSWRAKVEECVTTPGYFEQLIRNRST